MKAVVCDGFGPPEVLKIAEVDLPVPRRGQVRVRIVATSVTASDTMVRGLKFPRAYRVLVRLMYGVRRQAPRLGIVFSGEVESVGKGVTAFRAGDQVFGMSQWKGGCYAEYVCCSASGLIATKPANLSHEEAVALPYGGLLGAKLLAVAGIEAGQRVLVYGASGSIGTAVVQLAKHFGASVTAVCSTTNLALVKSLGADAVVDYTREDFTTKADRYDLVLDAVGKRKSGQIWPRVANALAPGGKALSIDEIRPWLRADDLLLLKSLAESGELKPVIDRTYPMEQIVDAHRYVDEGHKRGNVIITVGSVSGPGLGLGWGPGRRA